jgi:predicted Zn-dependent peptidase
MDYKKITLPNGLRVITAPMKNTETVTVIVMVGVGSRYEGEKEAGISHFLEHMFFKGTKKRPNTLDIAEELDSIGGEFNAFTSKDRTMYYAKVDAKHLSTALDVVSDIYLNSKIDVSEIEREKGTIIQELNMYEDTPLMSIGDVFEKLLYDGNYLGREIIGYKNTIQSFGRKNFVDYMKRFYVAGDTAVAIAGKFNEKEAINKTKKYFSAMSKGKKPKFQKVREKQIKPKIKIKYKETDQTHFILGNRAFDQDHKDRFALSLLAVVLGGNMSSRLFTEVRERRGLAYRISTGVESYADCGYIATQAGVNHDKLGITIKTILDEYRKISTKKLSPKEIQNAKDFIKGKSIMGLESSDEVAMFLIDQEVRKKKIMSMEEIFKKIDQVTENDILRVAQYVFQNKKLNLAVIGPHKNEKKINELLKL